MIKKKIAEKQLIIASSNGGKVKEFRQLLQNFPVVVISKPRELQVDETGKTFAENARLKALAVAKATGHWSLADDSGLSVDALAGAPGVLSSRYADSDSGRIARLLSEMATSKDRRAHFSAALCIASPNNEVLLEVMGRCEGFITNAPRGHGGFGYDPIFEVESTGLTFAEMGHKKKQELGHRGRAFALLEPVLQSLLTFRQ